MKNKKVRDHDQQIKDMLISGYTSRKLRALHISPKRIARISRGEEGKPPGAQTKITNDQKMWMSEFSKWYHSKT